MGHMWLQDVNMQLVGSCSAASPAIALAAVIAGVFMSSLSRLWLLVPAPTSGDETTQREGARLTAVYCRWTAHTMCADGRRLEVGCGWGSCTYG